MNTEKKHAAVIRMVQNLTQALNFLHDMESTNIIAGITTATNPAFETFLEEFVPKTHNLDKYDGRDYIYCGRITEIRSEYKLEWQGDVEFYVGVLSNFGLGVHKPSNNHSPIIIKPF